LVRVVLDRTARLPLASRLVQTVADEPLLVAVGPEAAAERVAALEQAGCEVWRSESPDSAVMLTALCSELGQRRLTNLMVEGGAGVLQAFFAAALVDEVWAFIAPRVAGGGALSSGPPASLPPLTVEAVEQPGGDLFLRGVT
jgi:diaminohydroxyphosphoribosylaminopyrimidine deaminase/5-amino-6-(5-phosphoribosylamino)uracil reductase